ADASGRAGSPKGQRDRHDWRRSCRVGGQGGNQDNPNCLRRRPRPVPFGLVASHSRPGGNATGVNFLVAELGSKQLGLLGELIPAAARIGLLVNPKSPTPERAMTDVTAAASAMGLQVDVVQASDSREIEPVFGTLIHSKADALLVGPDAFFVSRRL